MIISKEDSFTADRLASSFAQFPCSKLVWIIKINLTTCVYLFGIYSSTPNPVLSTSSFKKILCTTSCTYKSYTYLVLRILAELFTLRFTKSSYHRLKPRRLISLKMANILCPFFEGQNCLWPSWGQKYFMAFLYEWLWHHIYKHVIPRNNTKIFMPPIWRYKICHGLWTSKIFTTPLFQPTLWS